MKRTKVVPYMQVSAKVKRKDGTVEDLGVISRSKLSRRQRWRMWRRRWRKRILRGR